MGERTQHTGKCKTTEEKTQRCTQRDCCAHSWRDEHGEENCNMAREREAQSVKCNLDRGEDRNDDTDRAQHTGERDVIECFCFLSWVSSFLSFLLNAF